MHRLSKAILLASIAGVAAQDTRFEPRPASAYAARQTVNNLTIAAEPYEDREKIKEAFGKTDLEKLGVLPILLVIANDSDRVLHLEGLRVQLITADRQKVDPIPSEDVYRSGPVRRPDLGPKRSPFPGIGRGRRTFDEALQIAAREFVAPVVPARGSAHGFFYFRIGKGPDRLPGSTLYITGIRDAQTGQELLYFEIGLDPYLKTRHADSNRNRR